MGKSSREFFRQVTKANSVNNNNEQQFAYSSEALSRHERWETEQCCMLEGSKERLLEQQRAWMGKGETQMKSNISRFDN